MARRKRPAIPDPGQPPPSLLTYDEAEWADDREDANFLPGGEYAHPGLVRFRCRQRWRRAQEQWSVTRGLHRYHLLNIVHGTVPPPPGRT
jgi:hypothetical protein